MVNKQKPKKKNDPNQITALSRPDEDEGLFLARIALRPTVQAAVTLKEYDKSYGDLDLNGLIAVLTEQTKASNDGDLGRGEAMLTTQAHTLDAICNNLARRAINAEYMDRLDSYLKLALRAQSQCRATWEALGAIKNPTVMGYVRQAKLIQQWRPWEKSTGPKTRIGKEKASQNAYKGGSWKLLRELATALREQRRQLNT